jgi:hypothetical protein
MTALSEKSIICKKPRLTALHAGIVLTPPLNPDLIRVNRIIAVIQDGRCPKKTHAKEKASKFDLNWSKT